MKNFFIDFVKIVKWIRLIIVSIVIIHAFRLANFHLNISHSGMIIILSIAGIAAIFIIQTLSYRNNKK